MKVQSLWPQQGRIWLAALCVALFAALVGLQTPALAAANPGGNDDPSIRGLVEQMPPDGGLVGAWVIDGVTYTTTDTTVFEQENGPFAQGSCVKATLTAVDATTVTKLETEPAGDCDGNGGGDDGGGDHGGHGDGPAVYGFVDARPADSPVGPWTIDGVTYTVTAQTELKTEYGPLVVDACVKAHLTNDNTNTVRELESERSYHCNGEGRRRRLARSATASSSAPSWPCPQAS